MHILTHTLTCVYFQAIIVCCHTTLSLQIDIGEGIKPPGYYIQRAGGLFPAPYPQDGDHIEQVEAIFRFLGTLLAKCLQDGRLIDLPLSRPFLKLLCMGEVGQGLTRQLTLSSLDSSSGGDMGRSIGADTLTESWLSEDSSGELIASIQEMEKEMKLDPDRAKQVGFIFGGVSFFSLLLCLSLLMSFFFSHPEGTVWLVGCWNPGTN